MDYKEPIFGQTLLKLSVYNRKYESVKTLLEFGTNPNTQDDSDKISPLMEAAMMGGGGNVHPFADVRFLKILLKYGGDPNAVQDGDKIKYNKTCFKTLELACLSGVFDYVKILLDAGAEIQRLGDSNNSLLYFLIVGGNPDITLLLLEKGSNFRQPMYVNVKASKNIFLML